ncbi:hypothetical protein Tco_1098401 [Tanacetum coccineum]
MRRRWNSTNEGARTSTMNSPYPKNGNVEFKMKDESLSGDGVVISPDGAAPPDLLYLIRRNPEVLRKFQEDDSWMTI